MAGAKTYRVVGPLATPYREDGSRAYLYEGAEWPADAFREGETDRFLELGLIAESKAAEQDEPAARKSGK